MPRPPKNGLIPIRQLRDAERQDIETLAALCRRYEGIDLPLYLDPSAGDDTNHFFFYQNDVLIGFATAPPDDPIEVLGMVHPDHRRRGIGRALLAAVRQESRRRGVTGLLLVCEGASPSGIAFARVMGAVHRFSEYRMELDRAAYAQRPPPHRTLELRVADARDLDALVGLWTASREVAEDEARRVTARWLGQDNQRLYIGRLQQEPVGMLRLHMEPSTVFIYSFQVHPRHRGRGVGRQILMGVLDRLIAENREHIMIEVSTDNTIALSLYESCGFQKVTEYLYFGLAA